MARRRNARRIIARVIVFLLLGAIVNVAVAWSISITDANKEETTYSNEFTTQELILMIVANAIPTGGDEFPRNEAEDLFASYAPDLISLDADLRGIHERRPGTSTTLVLAHTLERLNMDYQGVRVARLGWPTLSLASVMRIDGRLASRGLELEPVGAIEVSPVLERIGLVPGRYLPLRPLWPGFAINTVFYAVILWLFFAAPFALRRHLRIKRGLCPACAYPIGASDICTECGKPVKPRRGDGV